MRAIIQRVARASVAVDDEVAGAIGRGICVLVGICQDDTREDLDYIASKILNTRVFENEAGKSWAKSVSQNELEILCVSQFTLYAKLKGNKPDYHLAMGGERSQPMFEELLVQLRETYNSDRVKSGVFGAHMQVEIINDGPVTIVLDSNQRQPVTKPGEAATK